MINEAKSQLEPVTRIFFLDFFIHSISLKLLLPGNKLLVENYLCLSGPCFQEQSFS